ncbi:hypothetical protein MM213_08605 [Belliella sp. R4-6]|uniref:Lipoprotein n=1 Tax=Belliella alkalica TaxID=1730871 RepID=A0ABS9VAV4_9BACT|nr:hypothetical protein [Belliella alkalica]MCH7413541.1 hypothetical protein [Belliella alkalica]
MIKIKFYKLLVFCSFVTFLACTDKDELEPVIENQAVLKIDGDDFNVVNNNVVANENCEHLFVNVSYRDENKIRFNLKFDFTHDGDLRKVWYDELILPLGSNRNIDIFLTPNFDPTSTFEISNFSYNKETGSLYFNFSGTIFFERDNTIQKNVSGELNVKSVLDTDCGVAETGVFYSSDILNLYTISSGASKSHDDQSQRHQYFLSYGYSITFSLSGDLWDFPIDEIVFGEDQELDRIDFRKAIGTKVANQSGPPYQEWKDFETSGKIIIENRYTEIGEKRISGKLNLLVKDKGEVIYKLDGIAFKTYSFEE